MRVIPGKTGGYRLKNMEKQQILRFYRIYLKFFREKYGGFFKLKNIQCKTRHFEKRYQSLWSITLFLKKFPAMPFFLKTDYFQVNFLCKKTFYSSNHRIIQQKINQIYIQDTLVIVPGFADVIPDDDLGK